MNRPAWHITLEFLPTVSFEQKRLDREDTPIWFSVRSKLDFLMSTLTEKQENRRPLEALRITTDVSNKSESGTLRNSHRWSWIRLTWRQEMQSDA
jgi:hypothetical protein